MAHNEIKMFPDDQVLREGSTVMFCCIYTKETHITSMFFSNTPYKVINISPQVKAIRVENIKATNSFGVNFYCDRNSDVSAYNFVTCEYVSHCPTQFKCPHISKNSMFFFIKQLMKKTLYDYNAPPLEAEKVVFCFLKKDFSTEFKYKVQVTCNAIVHAIVIHYKHFLLSMMGDF